MPFIKLRKFLSIPSLLRVTINSVEFYQMLFLYLLGWSYTFLCYSNVMRYTDWFFFNFLNFKIFNSYMRSQTWTPPPTSLPTDWFLNVESTCILEIYPHLMIMCCWILLNISWGFVLHLHLWKIMAYNLFSWNIFQNLALGCGGLIKWVETYLLHFLKNCRFPFFP